MCRGVGHQLARCTESRLFVLVHKFFILDEANRGPQQAPVTTLLEVLEEPWTSAGPEKNR